MLSAAISDFKRGDLLESQGGGEVPSGTLIFPVRLTAHIDPVADEVPEQMLSTLERKQVVSFYF